MAAFTGYPVETFHFLIGLVQNNERAWFDAHRDDYQRYLVEPSLALIADLDAEVRAVSPFYRGVAKKQGGSLMRIYRDTRFSRDKTPYKTNIGIQLRHEGGKDVHAPGFYLHLDLESTFTGAGSWHPEPTDLLAYRKAVAAHPESYQDALAQARAAGLVPEGDSLKSVPRGFDAGHPLAAELKRKDFFVSKPLPSDLYQSPALVGELAQLFRASSAYMRFLCQALGVAY